MSSRDSRGAAASARGTVIVIVSAAIAFATGACSGGSDGDGGSDAGPGSDAGWSDPGWGDAGWGSDCRGGSDAAVEIWFPPGSGLMTVDSLVVRGGAKNPSNIVAVRVNGVLATTTSGHAEWEAEVPLAPGANPILVESEDIDGHVDTLDCVTITRTPFDLWDNVFAAALDPDAPRALVLEEGRNLSFLDLETGARDRISDDWAVPGLRFDHAVPDFANHRLLAIGQNVYEIDLATGDERVIAEVDFGSDLYLYHTFALALDQEHGRVVMIEWDWDWDPPPPRRKAIVAVDLDTGEGTVLSGEGPGWPWDMVGSGMELSQPTNLVLDPGGDTAYVLDEGHDALLSVDLSTGHRTMVASGLGVGGRYDLLLPTPMAIDAANHRVLIIGRDSGYLQAIDLATGARTILADLSPLESRIRVDGLMVDGARHRVIFRVRDEFMALDLSTGKRQPISNTRAGAGPPMFDPKRIVLNEARDRAHVTVQPRGYQLSGGILEVDLTTGNRRVVTALGEPTGSDFDAVDLAESVVLDEDHGRLLVGSSSRPQIMEVALDTRERTIVWDADAAFPGVGLTTTDLAPYEDDLLVAMSTAATSSILTGALCSVDPDTGAWETVSGTDTRAGPALRDPRGMAISYDDDLAFVAEGSNGFIVAIDLATGDRHQVSDSSTPFDFPDFPGMAYDHERDRLVMGHVRYDGGEGTHVIDVATGALAPVRVDGSVPGHASPNTRGLALGPKDYSLIVADHELRALVAIDPVSGQTVVLSR